MEIVLLKIKGPVTLNETSKNEINLDRWTGNNTHRNHLASRYSVGKNVKDSWYGLKGLLNNLSMKTGASGNYLIP